MSSISQCNQIPGQYGQGVDLPGADLIWRENNISGIEVSRHHTDELVATIFWGDHLEESVERKGFLMA